MVNEEIYVPMVELTRYSPKRNESRNLTVVRYTRYNKEDEEIGNYYMTPALRALTQEEGVRVLRQNGKPVMIMVNDKVFHLLTENIDRQLAVIRSRIASSRLLNNGVSHEARELMIEMHRLNKTGTGDLESLRRQIRNKQERIDTFESQNLKAQTLLTIVQDEEKKDLIFEFMLGLRESGMGYASIRGLNIIDGGEARGRRYWFDTGIQEIAGKMRENNERITRLKSEIDSLNRTLAEAIAALETGDDVYRREVDEFIEVMRLNPLFKEMSVHNRRLVLTMKESVWWRDEESGFVLPEVSIAIRMDRLNGGRTAFAMFKHSGSHPHCSRSGDSLCLGGFARNSSSYDLMQKISMLFQWKNSINPNDTLNHLCNFQRVAR